MRSPFNKMFAAYLREVRACCPAFLRRNLLRCLRAQARCLRAEEPLCDEDTLRERMGDPQEVVTAFEEVYFSDDERVTRERRRCIRGVVAVILAIALIIEATAGLLYWSNEYTEKHSTYVFYNSEEEQS